MKIAVRIFYQFVPRQNRQLPQPQAQVQQQRGQPLQQQARQRPLQQPFLSYVNPLLI